MKGILNVDTPAVLSLCAGIAGIDLGLKLALEAVRTVCYVEHEATVCDKLVARMEDGSLEDAPVWTDVKTFRGQPWRGRVDILTAGYPCQPFSCAGKQRGEKDPRHLWPDVARIIREVQPPVVFLENVENHLRIGFHAVAKELRSMGYELEAGIFTAEEVGAPHLRKRLFVLAYRAGIECRLRWNPATGDCDAIGQGPAHGSEKRNTGRRIAGRYGTELADAAQRGFRIVREPSGHDGFADGSDAELEDASRHGEYGSLRQDGGRGRGICETGDGVADAKSRRWPAQRTNNQGRQSDAFTVDRCLFPPGPADLDRWHEILRRDPTLEPGLCRESDGISARVERLRALGNGVVPLVAAYAFRTLARAAWARCEALPESSLRAAA
jgi:DNA (cytosine-5)-methyltransferase 1